MNLRELFRDYSSPMSSFHTSGLARMYWPSSETHSSEFKSITCTPSERSQSIPPWKVAAFSDDYRAETKLPDQAAAIPARRKRRDHDQIAIAALAAGVAEGIGLSVHRRIAILHAAIVARTDQLSAGVKDRRADGNATFGQAFAGFGQGCGKHGGIVGVQGSCSPGVII